MGRDRMMECNAQTSDTSLIQSFQPSNIQTFKPSKAFKHSNIQKIQTTRTVELDSLRWICPINAEPLTENSAAFR